MVTPADVRRWDPLGMEGAFRALGAARDRLQGLDAALPAARPPETEWQGAAADLARTAHDRIAEQLRTLHDDATALRPGLGAAIDAVVAVRAELVIVEGVAAAAGFVIGHDGAVTDVMRGSVDPGERAAALAMVAGQVRRVLDRAVEVDAHVRVLLQIAPPPPPTPVIGTSPAATAAWWKGLPAADRERFLADHPDQAGNLDGLPAAVRDTANRRTLATAITQTDAARVAAAGQLSALADAIDHGREGMDQIPRRDALTAQIERLDAHIAALHALQNRLQATTSRPTLLLAFQPDIGNGRAAVAVGDPDTAANVVTFVPGTSSRLDAITGDIAHADAVADSATLATPSARTAVITWDGYDAPQSIIPDAAQEHFADDAEPLLRSFQEGLRATHVGPTSRNTILGHSYGSTVVGHTARDGTLDADAIVFAGSPGVGVHDVRGLRRPPGTVYSTTGAADPIEITHAWWLGPADDALGSDPSNPRFGAHVFLADPHGGHSDYWNRGNPALRSFGRIATGREPLS